MAPRPTPPCHHGRHHRHHTPISCPGSKAPRKHTAASLTPTQHHPCSPEAPQNLREHNLRHLPPPSRARQLHPLAPLHLRRTLGHPSSRGPRRPKRKPLPSLTANIFFFALQPPQPRRQTKHQTTPAPGPRAWHHSHGPNAPARAAPRPFPFSSSFFLPQALPPAFLAHSLQHTSCGSSSHQHSHCSGAYTHSHLLASRRRRHPQALAPGGGSPRSAK